MTAMDRQGEPPRGRLKPRTSHDAGQVAKVPGSVGPCSPMHAVCVEEPLEIMIDDEPYYLTMRMPGEDMFLALGLCLTEGVISSFDDVLSVNHCIDSANRVNVYLSPGRRAPAAPARRKGGIAYASCGICGKELISDICTALAKSDRTVSISALSGFRHAEGHGIAPAGLLRDGRHPCGRPL